MLHPYKEGGKKREERGMEDKDSEERGRRRENNLGKRLTYYFHSNVLWYCVDTLPKN